MINGAFTLFAWLWLVADTDLLWEKSIADWLVAGADLVWEKNTASWLADKPSERSRVFILKRLWRSKSPFQVANLILSDVRSRDHCVTSDVRSRQCILTVVSHSPWQPHTLWCRSTNKRPGRKAPASHVTLAWQTGRRIKSQCTFMMISSTPASTSQYCS